MNESPINTSAGAAFTKHDVFASAFLGFLGGLLLVFIANRLDKHIPFGEYLWLALPMLAPLGLYCAYRLSAFVKPLFQFGKFGIVGVVNFLIDLGAFHAFIYLSGTENAGDLFTLGIVFTTWTFFKAGSFLVANINSFFWNKFWTFQEHEVKKTMNEYVTFFTVSIVGLIINSIVFSLVFHFRPEGSSDPVWGTFGAVAGAFAGFLWNFLGYKFIVFKK